MTTLTALSQEFPVKATRSNPGCWNKPLTGYIPIDYFLKHEASITSARKAAKCKTRVVFRGPRNSQYAQDTYREDATHAVIYTRAKNPESCKGF